MGRRSSVLTLVIINVIVTLVVVFAVISIINSQNTAQTPNRIVITVPILITQTKDPNVTQTIRIVTATPQPGTPGFVALPTGLIDDLSGTIAAAPTIDPSLLSGDSSLQLTVTSLPPHCIPYTVQDGDTPFAIAQKYGVNGADLMTVNGLTDQSAALLQIGDVLIIPLAGCSLTAPATPTETDTATQEVTAGPTPTRTPTHAPSTTPEPPTLRPTASNTATATLPPTATNAQVEIVRVISPGDINAEGVDVRNNGAVVDMTGWKLSDAAGDTYTFPQQRVFTGGLLTVYTRVGTDTPQAKFWGRDTALWSSGSTLTLTDSAGHVQSTYIVP